jgi:hypothetical protein
MSVARDKNNLTYRFDYYHEPIGRRALNDFVGKIFDGLDFSPWNDLGYAFPEYKPFSFFHEGTGCRQRLASAMNLTIEGVRTSGRANRHRRSDPEFRQCGLIRTLIVKNAHEFLGAPRVRSFSTSPTRRRRPFTSSSVIAR